ncbi:efflux transporter, RND family, MFP subunit [Pedosphaera parvula Ellin514]|uniref:Efflux transporter, RND family, MFP subunit n=2 Tax=Pedosphaera TaxID=1032526 RepID=B9XMU6_PEDPL|nr:efflux transporter, RND family, MFP subunit [Pedosphaera parvula Ellin514]
MVRDQLFRFSTVMLAVGGAGLLVAGCEHNQAQQQMPIPQVTVAKVEAKEVVEWDEFTGRTEAVETVEIRPRVSGYMQEVKFQSGQMVKKGDVLFVIDPRWYQADYNQKQASYEQARAHFENAEREAKRTGQLLSSKAISTEEAEARQSRFQEAKAALAAAEAMRDSSKLDLDYTEVRAPIDGRVSRALVTQGNFVSGISGVNTLLTTLVTVDPVYVYADVDENSLLKFTNLERSKKLEGEVPIELQLGDEEGFQHKGKIESFDNHLDPNTGSILLRAVFPNPDGKIMPGLFARIRVPLSERYSAPLIEERSIGTDQGQKFVLSLTSSNTVAYRAVKLGPLVDGKRIVRSGVQAGESIVVNGLQKVRPGAPVEPKEETATNASELKTAQR